MSGVDLVVAWALAVSQPAPKCGCEERGTAFCNDIVGACQSCPTSGLGACHSMGLPRAGEVSCRHWCFDVVKAATPTRKRSLQVGGICDETCQYAADGDCDDGGPGSEFTECGIGADCTDCGVRVPPPPQPPAAPQPPALPPQPPNDCENYCHDDCRAYPDQYHCESSPQPLPRHSPSQTRASPRLASPRLASPPPLCDRDALPCPPAQA